MDIYKARNAQKEIEKKCVYRKHGGIAFRGNNLCYYIIVVMLNEKDQQLFLEGEIFIPIRLEHANIMCNDYIIHGISHSLYLHYGVLCDLIFIPIDDGV